MLGKMEMRSRSRKVERKGFIHSGRDRDKGIKLIVSFKLSPPPPLSYQVQLQTRISHRSEMPHNQEIPLKLYIAYHIFTETASCNSLLY